MIKKVLLSKEGRKFYIEDTTKDYHCKFGTIKNEEFKKKKTKTNMAKELFIIPADFIDNYKRLKRGAQIMILKDLGVILAETGLTKDSVVVDAGSGSGAAAIFFSKHVKKVHSFEIDDKNLEIVEENIKRLEIKNIAAKKQDVYESIPVKNADLVLLDLPEPWRALENASKALKTGGFLVCYCPQVAQLQEVAKQLPESFLLDKVLENMQRLWH
ncbi:MAG: methyltransferase domain-containing protein, partial [archaeon]